MGDRRGVSRPVTIEIWTHARTTAPSEALDRSSKLSVWGILSTRQLELNLLFRTSDVALAKYEVSVTHKIEKQTGSNSNECGDLKPEWSAGEET